MPKRKAIQVRAAPDQTPIADIHAGAEFEKPAPSDDDADPDGEQPIPDEPEEPDEPDENGEGTA